MKSGTSVQLRKHIHTIQSPNTHLNHLRFLPPPPQPYLDQAISSLLKVTEFTSIRICDPISPVPSILPNLKLTLHEITDLIAKDTSHYFWSPLSPIQERLLIYISSQFVTRLQQDFLRTVHQIHMNKAGNQTRTSVKF